MKKILRVLMAFCLVSVLSYQACYANVTISQEYVGASKSRPAVTTVVLRDEVTAETVETTIEALKVATAARNIVLVIDTPGGSVNAGKKLAAAIENSPVPVHCVVDGMAASMGFYLLQSCAKRSMTRHSRLMIHQAYFSGDLEGPVKITDLGNLYEYLRTMNEAALYYYARRALVSVDYIREKIADGKNWWLLFIEAKQCGFIDSDVASVAEVVKLYKPAPPPAKN